MITAREAAFCTLSAFKRNSAWSDIFLANLAEKENMDRRDTALAYAIAYGVLQNSIRCDYYISAYSSIKPKKMEDAVLNILRLSTYQLVFMDKIPDNAVVNEGVKLAKKHCPRASGFINAVLRKLAANKNSLPEIPKKNYIEFLSVKYSHPKWLVNYFCDRLGNEEAEMLMAENNKVSPVYVQTNTLKTDAAMLAKSLESEGCECKKHPWLDGCFDVKLGEKLEKLTAFKNGWLQVQDAAARLDVIAASPKADEKILDCCAAPGGKSFAAAMLMQNKGSITSCDVYPQKIMEINAGAKRLGIEIIHAMQADASFYKPEFDSAFDTVIADVPCSGIGIIRKKPEIRYKAEESISGLPEIQRKIIENVARYVKPGGKLVYSTCTLMKCENEDIIIEFLKNNPEFMPESFELPSTVGIVESGMITLWPQKHGTDGFFISVLRRRK